ncbi:cobaltochelatase subunit CobN [Nitrosomonas sp.]|uniref:cobaltochelatase subunit CobN n=1 Tax=Nitrosomonas sp. TaxID=42353 RepID=UPI0037C560D5
MRFRLLLGLLVCLLPMMATAAKVAVLSTSFVLERKFKLMETAAREHGLELAWTQVDREGKAGVARVLDNAAFAIIDAPNDDAMTQIEQMAGEDLRARAIPFLGIHLFNLPMRMQAQHMEEAQVQRLFSYYVGGTRINHERMMQYLKAWLEGGDLSAVPLPVELPNGGIYHPDADQMIFASLPEYLDWWQQRHNRSWQDNPVIGMETSSSYLSDGQTRQFDETITAIERAGGVPVVFYRGSRVMRSKPVARLPEQAITPPGEKSLKDTPATRIHDFPNPLPLPSPTLDEPLVTLDGKLILHALMVNTFLGVNPDGRKAWYQSLGIPVINFMQYRTGTRTGYMRDNAGVSSFLLPFWLTVAEYIGLQDPVIVTTNEEGELAPMPEQMDLLVGKLINLARLAMLPNSKKNIALLFWNHPPGEHNQGASNLNVPRSVVHLVERLRGEGYAFDTVSEDQIHNGCRQNAAPGLPSGFTDGIDTNATLGFFIAVSVSRMV